MNDMTGSTKLSCSHQYHLGCIVKWLSIKSSCPCCRNNLSVYEDVKQEAPVQHEEYEMTQEELIYAALIEMGLPTLDLPPQILRIPLVVAESE